MLVQHPPSTCSLGCEDLNFCASKMPEMREKMQDEWHYVTCNAFYDGMAKQLYDTWLEKGVFTMSADLTFESKSGFFFTNLNRTSCSLDRLHSLACMLTLEPCIDKDTKWPFCLSDCIYMMSYCGTYDEKKAATLCWSLNIRSDEKCFNTMSFHHLMTNLTDPSMGAYEVMTPQVELDPKTPILGAEE